MIKDPHYHIGPNDLTARKTGRRLLARGTALERRLNDRCITGKSPSHDIIASAG